MNNIANFDIQYLHPKIWVFKKAFKESLEMIDHFENEYKNEWTGWYTFGNHVTIPSATGKFETFPSDKEWQEKMIDKTSDIYAKKYLQLFYDTTKQYCDSLKINLNNWVFDTSDIAKYNANAGVSETRAMSYHTDYQQEKSMEPGNKFNTTCLFYLNDNYEGGDLCFRIFNDELTEIIEEISYKPSAGDIVIFPAIHPFYHGVKIVESGFKYIIRSYWRYWYDGDEAYLKEQAMYSEEEWELIKKERYKDAWNRVGGAVNQ